MNNNSKLPASPNKPYPAQKTERRILGNGYGRSSGYARSSSYQRDFSGFKYL